MIKITDSALRKLVNVDDSLLTDMFKEMPVEVSFEEYGVLIIWTDTLPSGRNSICVFTDAAEAAKRKEYDRTDNCVTWVENVRFCRTL